MGLILSERAASAAVDTLALPVVSALFNDKLAPEREAERSCWAIDIAISEVALRGWFERQDGNISGGLWFSRRGSRLVLDDYDGVFELPSRVSATLVAMGVEVDMFTWTAEDRARHRSREIERAYAAGGEPAVVSYLRAVA